jgi:F0F1-type ATP synthase assembly protein I
MVGVIKNSMRTYFLKLLKTFDYHDYTEWFVSLAPSIKYKMVFITLTFSSVTSGIDMVFGLDWLAFAGFFIIMLTELVTGIKASMIRKEQFSSMRLSRFGFKVFYYLVLMAIPYVFAQSYHKHGDDLASFFFQWLHVFLTVHIVLENIISILENGAVINGGDKSEWIEAIKLKLSNLMK